MRCSVVLVALHKLRKKVRFHGKVRISINNNISNLND